MRQRSPIAITIPPSVLARARTNVGVTLCCRGHRRLRRHRSGIEANPTTPTGAPKSCPTLATTCSAMTCFRSWEPLTARCAPSEHATRAAFDTPASFFTNVSTAAGLRSPFAQRAISTRTSSTVGTSPGTGPPTRLRRGSVPQPSVRLYVSRRRKGGSSFECPPFTDRASDRDPQSSSATRQSSAGAA